MAGYTKFGLSMETRKPVNNNAYRDLNTWYKEPKKNTKQ